MQADILTLLEFGTKLVVQSQLELNKIELHFSFKNAFNPVKSADTTGSSARA